MSPDHMPRISSISSKPRGHIADWERTQKPRVWKNQFRLLFIALLSLVMYAALPATLYFTARLIMEPEAGWQFWALGALITLVVSLVLGVILSATTRCSLCHGTPFFGHRCRKHALANKLPLLSYRASCLAHVLFTWKFRCMFCSTPYRLGPKN